MFLALNRERTLAHPSPPFALLKGRINTKYAGMSSLGGFRLPKPHGCG